MVEQSNEHVILFARSLDKSDLGRKICLMVWNMTTCGLLGVANQLEIKNSFEVALKGLGLTSLSEAEKAETLKTWYSLFGFVGFYEFARALCVTDDTNLRELVVQVLITALKEQVKKANSYDEVSHVLASLWKALHWVKLSQVEILEVIEDSCLLFRVVELEVKLRKAGYSKDKGLLDDLASLMGEMELAAKFSGKFLKMLVEIDCPFINRPVNVIALCVVSRRVEQISETDLRHFAFKAYKDLTRLAQDGSEELFLSRDECRSALESKLMVMQMSLLSLQNCNLENLVRLKVLLQVVMKNCASGEKFFPSVKMLIDSALLFQDEHLAKLHGGITGAFRQIERELVEF